MGSRIKDNPERIFDVYMEVVHSGAAEPEVRRIFPDDYADQDTLQTVPKFCFPFSMDSVTVGQVGQNFTFVLTDVESKQRFGFCRLTYGAQSCSCILSYLPWFEVFYKLLNVLDDYTITGQESLRKELLECLHSSSIPVPGTSMYLNVHAVFTVPDPRKLPSIPENRNLTDYFVAVDVNNMLHLYASMLYERRILIISSKLSTLTACIHAAAAMLYPMYWQHVYIPVLPYHLIDYCGAPMPYLIGIHSSLIEKVQGMALDDVVVLNVDNNSLQTPFDDLHSLPSDVVSSLRSRLKKVSMTMGDGVARAFLKAQAALFGSYRNALHIEPEEPITFNEDAFITHRSSTMRQFLQNATQLQFFKEFIDGRLDLLNSGEGFGDVFEEEINMGEYAGSDRVYHQWLVTFKKGGGALFNTMKTKANPAMRTVYKFAKDHAKIGIKEVKSRLKQKELTDNGYCSSRDEPGRIDLVSTHCKDVHTWEHRKPITVHLGKGLQNNLRMDNHHGQSLKDTNFEEEEKAGCLQGKTALSSPITTKFSELSLLENSFTNKQEKLTHNSLKQKVHAEFNSAWGLEDLSFICEPEEQQGNFKYQRLDLRGNEHRPESFLDEEHSNHSKILSQTEQDPVALYEQEFPCLNRPLSIPSLEPCVLNQESSKSTQHWTETRNITLSCPQSNNSAEPLAVRLPTVTQLQELTQGNGEVVVGGQDFHQALTVCPLKQSDSHNTETGTDLLCLLDPLSGAAEQSTPPLQSRPALPPFQPPVCLNSFTQVPHFYVRKCYGTVPPGNPFSPPYVYPQTAACFHTPPLLMFSQASHMSETQKNETWLADRAPPASISNSSLYSLLDSPPPPTLAQVLHPTQTVGNPNDPFSDLLTIATASTVMTTTSPQKMDELQRRWETFD